MRRRQRVYEVTGKQIWFVLITAVIALTVVFEIGVYTGKKRVINAELTAEQQGKVLIVSESEKPQKEAEKLPSKQFKTESQPIQIDNASKAAAITLQDKHMPSILKPDKPKEQNKTESVAEKKTEYAVKFGTFGYRNNAENLVAKLRSSGYESRMEAETTAEKEVYHVLVGRFDNIDEAKDFGNSLKEKLSYIDSYIIKKTN